MAVKPLANFMVYILMASSTLFGKGMMLSVFSEWADWISNLSLADS